MHKKYLRISLSIIFGILFFISIINFIVDPGKIYLTKKMNDYYTNQYISKLKKANNGLVQNDWNERTVKTAFAKNFIDNDCVILGSSHIMGISSVRNTGNITNQCKKVLNLGVSGGSIEDMFVFSNIILSKKILPNQVFLSIDPWTLKFDMDIRYLMNKDYYVEMLKKLDIVMEIDNSYENKVLKNLINKEYFLKSIELLRDSNEKLFNFSKIEEVNTTFNMNNGYKKAVTLSDGSHIYANSWIQKQKESIKNIPIGGGDYKISGDIYDEKVIDNLEKLIKFYQEGGVKVNFLITPYHPNVFKQGNTKPVVHMKAITKKVLDLSNKFDILIYGSFNPEMISCNENEFFDFMHATSECLNKIDLSGLHTDLDLHSSE
ncbi:MAG: hypothetical protein RBR59_05675 [Sulfurimonadaceae bacterium]|jgi:hypothetical protein|nr:hypothetical protein [Sulfurimonadaceae bacterium]